MSGDELCVYYKMRSDVRNIVCEVSAWQNLVMAFGEKLLLYYQERANHAC